ncbi:serine/threonine protein kinase [Entomophthora muscae]|uniref:Serine/threonine protein kinase n=1 Tax=Entomophthora muscae TaxID=34485 RepID=A0ACC2TB13_9FUNG|nr:serine/threonine protein kinase [Entomophthora muscae]
MSATEPSTPRKRVISDFKFGKLLGEGSYSSVFEAEEILTKKSFAIKVLSKRFIIKENKAKYVNIEKQALTILSRHPCIVKLHYTFQDPTRLFFAVDLVPNGELLHYIRQKGCFDLETSQFYAAELVSSIEYMHKKGVAHRDLKPENILLGENMHIKITDFGSAKLLNSPKADPIKASEKTASFVGTAEYASPELLEDKDASRGADFWALGCIIYQMLTGSTPFKASNDYQIFQRITSLKYEFPEGFPETAKQLVNALLVRDPESRLGYKDISEIKRHPFFTGINWEQLHVIDPPSLGVPPPESSSDEFNIFHLDESKLPLV